MKESRPPRINHACEFCSQSTDCSNLYTALRLLESSLRQHPIEEHVVSLEEIKQHLAAGGFNFPGGGHCQFAQDPEAIRDYINQCIALLNDHRQKKNEPSEGSA